MSKPVILVADDLKTNRSMIKAFLPPGEYSLLEAADGTEAWEIAKNRRPDLILLDVVMPGQDGYEVCRRVKSQPELGYVPVIMLTSLDQMDAKIKGLEAGADDFLTKPFQKIELLTRIKNLLKIKSLNDSVRLRNQIIREVLNRYIDKNVIDQILSDPEKYLQLGGMKTNIAVMFCDIRGFTSISEVLEAEAVIDLLNNIFSRLTGVVFNHGGTFDKFMGDCVMVFWGAPVTTGDDACNAVRAALEMQSAFDELKKEWPENLQSLGIGIGINYGEAIVGNIGAEHVMDYTVIGDVVNTAQRLQSVARAGQTLVTGDVLSQTGDKFRSSPHQHIELKGKVKPVEIFEVLGVV
jgi:adenylate cyclase